MSGIYGLPIEAASFQKFCGGNLQGEHESCVEVGQIPGTTEAYVLRDSKPEGAGKELRFTQGELDTFVVGYAAQRGLKL
ncbi:DUF397 domain-containing protein [Streptomyces sp. NPDC001393]